MLLKNNGKASLSKCMCHFNIRYFFIMDQIKRGDLSIDYCPTGEMVANYMSKPVQGALFSIFRKFIMGFE
jgi:hypothetical protein